MKLYVFVVAPNPTRVRLMLEEKRAAGAEINLPEVMVNLAQGEQKSPEHLARNPQGKLPVLELDNGSHLTESGAIIEYLEELYPEPSMLGSSPGERARGRELGRIAELGVLGPAARLVHATKSPLGADSRPEVAEDAREALAAPMALLDELLGDGRPFVAGDCPTLADCTLAAAFQFVRFAELDIVSGYDELARWDAAYRERPAAQAVLVA